MNLQLTMLPMVLRSRVVAPSESQDLAGIALERRIARGDRDALAEALREHAPLLIRYAATLVHRDEASDMGQRALERIVKNLGSFDPERGRFRTWAITITRNVCIDHLRRRRDLLAATSEPVEPADLSPQADPARALESKQGLVALERAMGDLPEGMRSALTLFHVHGESYDSIATILDVPKGTVMTWLHRGRKQLRDRLDGAAA